MSRCSRFTNNLTDYCEHSSLVGLAYISNQKIHITERLFWLVCIIISTGGAYHLIQEYQHSYESNAISLVLEGTRPHDKSFFPAIVVCEIGGDESLPITKYIQGLYEAKGRTDYSYDIEDYLRRIVFPNLYSEGTLKNYCGQFLDCTDCVKCPSDGYAEIARMVRLICSDLMEHCTWNGKPFDCCHYFQPLQTPTGLCFAMNSLQATSRNGPHWFKTDLTWAEFKAELILNLTSTIELSILNEEDVPIYLLRDHMFGLAQGYKSHDIQFTMRNIINDPGVRNVPQEYRKCRFPDEQFKNASYKYYSSKTCIADCLKQLHLRKCNCTTHNLLVKSDDKSLSCDYDGIMCLELHDLVNPKSNILQPWRPDGLDCECLPSCTDHEVIIIEDTGLEDDHKKNTHYIITQVAPTEQFRRQAVRTQLDVVVTIGGILGLFMGASVLSGIEILYFFLIRVFNSKKEC